MSDPLPSLGPVLEARLATWREQLLARLGDHDAALPELEDHLRSLIADRLEHGDSPEAAVEHALSRIGDFDALAAEFRKVPPKPWMPARIAWLIWLAASAMLAWVGVLRLREDSGWVNILLTGHVITLLIGCAAIAIAGLLGGVLILRRWFAGMPPGVGGAYQRGHRRFMTQALLFVGMGTVLGVAWACVAADPSRVLVGRALQTPVILAWLLIDCYLQPRFGPREQLTALFSLVGTLNLSTCWLGLIAWRMFLDRYSSSNPPGVILAALIVIHLGLGALAFVPPRRGARATGSDLYC